MLRALEGAVDSFTQSCELTGTARRLSHSRNVLQTTLGESCSTVV